MNAKLGGTIEKPKNVKYRFFPLGLMIFFSKENSGHMTYRAYLCCSRQQKQLNFKMDWIYIISKKRMASGLRATERVLRKY